MAVLHGFNNKLIPEPSISTDHSPNCWQFLPNLNLFGVGTNMDAANAHCLKELFEVVPFFYRCFQKKVHMEQSSFGILAHNYLRTDNLVFVAHMSKHKKFKWLGEKKEKMDFKKIPH